ncbi:hypothetical protein V2J09_004054, partial [Rumex salicifolius]
TTRPNRLRDPTRNRREPNLTRPPFESKFALPTQFILVAARRPSPPETCKLCLLLPPVYFRFLLISVNGTMSRICVKQLPLKAKEDELRNFFSQKGEVTDVKIIRTNDGKSRQFGFIGYRTSQEAEEAIRYFNKSFMGASRIFCETAHKVGDSNIPRPWSKHSKEKQEKLTKEVKEVDGGQDSTNKGPNNNANKKEITSNDPKLEEFLQVMQPRSKSKLWADDTLVAHSVDKNSKITENLSLADKVESKLMKVGPKKSSQKDRVLEEEALEDSSNHTRDEISDADYFKSRVKTDWSDSESDDEDTANENDDSSVEEHRNKKGYGKMETEEHESIDGNIEKAGHFDDNDREFADSGNPSMNDSNEESLDSGRLFVRNLPYTTTEDELQELFIRFGDVAEVHLVVDKETKRSKGFAYVLYRVPEAASRALEELDHSDFQGRVLHILPSKSKPSQNPATSFSTENAKTFKQKREEKRKASDAGGDKRSWNTLFIRSDTVAENIARKYGVSKSELYDIEASDLAVRMAAGETEIISETKKALASAGVNVASLEDFASGKTEGLKRSNYVLLVKNLPYNTNEAELMEMFGRYGGLDKVILPPTRTMALVVFLESGEARKAFSKLAYKRYKAVPLYLEWAPSNILNPETVSRNDEKNYAVVGENEAKKVLLQEEVGMGSDEIDTDKIESHSLFVKNLNFKTTEESLRKHVTKNIKDEKVISVRIQKHLKKGKNVSKGFGFIEFDSAETTANACKDLQGSVLDSHALILEHCRPKRNAKVDKKVENDLSSTKLIVRNVAFEASEKELRQLFSLYGQVKSLRLPKKFGNHRGFAFVEYSTKQETEKALQSLSSSHFYGRHLVLERAKEAESLEELRVKTALNFSDERGGSNIPGRESKRRKLMTASNGDEF